MKLSFMTWVTPNWTLERIVNFASEVGYEGVELRVDVGHRHGVNWKTSSDERRRIRRLFADNGVKVSCIATSISFGFPSEKTRMENVRLAKKYIQLASDLETGIVRFFGGVADSGRIIELTDSALDYIASAYTEVGEFGSDYDVCPLLEMHDAFSVERYSSPVEATRKALEVLKRAETRNIGILWNQNALDEESFSLIGKYIKHFHINKMEHDPEEKELSKTMKLMHSIGFKGFFSLEHIWRKSLKGLPPEKILEDHIRITRKILMEIIR